MTVISMAQVRCPRSGGKTCLPLLGALATGAPALWPACVQLNDVRIHLGPSGGPAQWQATAWEALFSRLIADRKIGSCVRQRLPRPFTSKEGRENPWGSGSTGAW